MASICIHCMHLLVNNSQELCRRTGINLTAKTRTRFEDLSNIYSLLIGLPFLSYADVAETCFATHSNARYVAQTHLICRCLQNLITRYVYYKSLQVKKNSSDSKDCDRHLSLYHTGTIRLLVFVKLLSRTINIEFTLSLDSAVSTLSLWLRIYNR